MHGTHQKQFRVNLENCHENHCRHGHGDSFRRFQTSDEIVEHLEQYKEQLSKELEGVTEYIQKLQKK